MAKLDHMLTLGPGEYGQSHPNHWPEVSGPAHQIFFFLKENLLLLEEAKELMVDRQNPQISTVVVMNQYAGKLALKKTNRP